MKDSAALILAVFDAVQRRDRDKLFDLYDDDVVFCDAASLPYGGTFRGKSRLRDQMEHEPERTWLATWGPLQPTQNERRMDPRIVAATDTEVTVVYTQRALGANGERFTAPVVGMYEVRQGKLARAQMFHFDTAAIVAFLQRSRAAESAS